MLFVLLVAVGGGGDKTIGEIGVTGPESSSIIKLLFKSLSVDGVHSIKVDDAVCFVFPRDLLKMRKRVSLCGVALTERLSPSPLVGISCFTCDSLTFFEDKFPILL
jgi:hypothetical protein